MSKMKQIAALTAMLVGVILYASPAKSAVCFLPDDDGSCGGGDIEISDNSSNQDQCTNFKLSKNQRDSKEYSSDCYSCEPCTYNNRTTYKCSPKSGATWYGNLGVCCTNGETYDSTEGKCCPAGGCTHECPSGKSWNKNTKSCKCDNGKDADGDICCADSEYVSNGICCTTGKENVNGVCVCKQGTIPDGTGCKPDDNPKCNDINPHYYPISDTAKYNECKELDEYYNDGEIFVMETTNITGSDGKCFYCHHRTCAEIAEYIEAGEQWYPVCKDNEIATKMPYLPGADGQCYTCQAKKCKDYAKEAGKTYVLEDDDWECEKATGKNADVFDVIPREVAADGQCYECKLLKCNEISSIYGNKDMECQAGYHLVGDSDYIAADGQCYYCVKNTVEVVFEYELQGNEDAGHYTQCVWDGSSGYNLSLTNEMHYCNRDYYGEEYNIGDYYNPNKYYKTCKHVSNWDAYLEVSGNGVDGYDAKTWTLPYDMELVVTYDIPYMNADSCLGGSENGLSKIRWASKGAIQTYPEIFAPRTVRMKFPKGTAVGAHIRKEPVDYLDGMTTDHFKMEYYVNGKKVSESSKIGDVRYNFSGSWN